MKTIQETIKEIFTEAETANWSLLQIQIAIDMRLKSVLHYQECRARVNDEFVTLVGELFDHFSDVVIDAESDHDGAKKLRWLASFMEHDPQLITTHSMNCALEDKLLEFG